MVVIVAIRTKRISDKLVLSTVHFGFARHLLNSCLAGEFAGSGATPALHAQCSPFPDVFPSMASLFVPGNDKTDGAIGQSPL